MSIEIEIMEFKGSSIDFVTIIWNEDLIEFFIAIKAFVCRILFKSNLH